MWNDEECQGRLVGSREVASAWALFTILLIGSLGVSGVLVLVDGAAPTSAEIRQSQQVKMSTTPEAAQRAALSASSTYAAENDSCAGRKQSLLQDAVEHEKASLGKSTCTLRSSR